MSSTPNIDPSSNSSLPPQHDDTISEQPLSQDVTIATSDTQQENPAAEESTANLPSSPPPPQDLFKLKEITPSLKIVLQNKNGPCPLLALANALALRDGKTLSTIHPDESFVGLDRILMILADRLLTTVQVKDQNMERMVQDAISILPRMAKGLDVNVKFDGGFEFTDVLEVFDLFDVPVLHGWCVDPDDTTRWELLSKLSYNMATERVFLMMDLLEKEDKTADDERAITEGYEIQSFLQETQGQLTEFGLQRVAATLRDNGVGVFYWNAHFSTIVKHNGRIYLLATDEGYYNEKEIVFQRLESATGDSQYCRADFTLLSEPPAPVSEPKNQVDADFQLAMQIQNQEEERLRKARRGEAHALPLTQQQPPRGQQSMIDNTTAQPQHAPRQQPAPINTTSTHQSEEQHLTIPHSKPRKPSPKASAHLNDPKMRYKNTALNLASLNEERRQRQMEQMQSAEIRHWEEKKRAKEAKKSDGDKCVIS